MSYILFILLILAPDPALFALLINANDERTIQIKRWVGLTLGALLQIATFTLFMLVLEAKSQGLAVFISFLGLMFLFNNCWRVLKRNKEVAHRIPKTVGGSLIWRLQHLGLPAAFWVIQPFKFDSRVNPYAIVDSAKIALLLAIGTWLIAVFYPIALGDRSNLEKAIRLAHTISIVVLLILLIRIWL